ncbi:hypothetical protein IFM89_032818, partial [Coptis chinensis]
LFFSKPTLIVSSASIHTDIEKKESNKPRNPAADFKVSSISDLRKLSLQPFPVNRSPYFQLNMSGNQDYTIDFNRPQLELPSIIQFPHVRVGNHGGNQDIEHPKTLCMGITINSQNIYAAKSTNQVLQNHYSYPLRVGNGLKRPPSSNTLLKEIHHHLLGDSMPSTFSDEQKVKEQAAINNNGTSDIEYNQSTNNTTSSWSNGESSGHGTVLSKETVNVLPVKEHIENMQPIIFRCMQKFM